jgi:hypothetical protein
MKVVELVLSLYGIRFLIFEAVSYYKLTLELVLDAGPALSFAWVRVAGLDDLAASRAFFFAARGSPLFSARSVAVRLRRRARESDERDIGCRFRWIDFEKPG